MKSDPAYISGLGGSDAVNPTGVPTTISLDLLLMRLRQRWVIVLSIASAFVFAAAAFLILAPPRYLATAQIIVDPRGLHVLEKEVNPRAQNTDVQIPLVESEMRVVKSTKVLDRVIDQEALEKDAEFAGGAWPSAAAIKALVWDLLGRRMREADRVAVMYALEERIAVRRAERSFVIDITVATRDADKSARLANALVRAYMEENAEAQAEHARRSEKALASRLEELRARVSDASNRAEEFKARHDMVGAGGRLVSDQQLANLNDQLGVARTRTAEARARIEQIERLRSADAGSFAEAVLSPTVMNLRAQYADIKRRHADLAARLGSRHPDLASIERELIEAQASIAAEVARVASAARADYERAKASDDELQKNLDAQSKRAVLTSKDLVRLRELEREVSASRAVYEAALMRSRELKEQTLLDSTNVRHITVATPPLRSSSPPASLVLPLALIVGIFVGAGAAFAAGTTDSKVHSRDESKAATRLPVFVRVARTAQAPRAGWPPAAE